MTDLNEQALARDLHLRPLPAKRIDIAQRSIALGRRMRRRRRAGVVTVLAAVILIVGVALGGGNQFGRLEPVPANSPVAVPADSPSSSGTDIPNLVPTSLTAGPAPTVDYVLNGTWVRADGRKVPLTDPASLVTDDDRGDGFVRFDGGLLAIRDLDDGPGRYLGYSLDGGPPIPIRGVSSRVLGGPQPGPEGSVLIPVVGGYAVAHADGTWSVEKRFGDPTATDAPSVAALRDAVFHTVHKGSTSLVRRSALDPDVEIVDHEGRTRPVTSNIAGDRIVLADGKGCQEVRRQKGWLGSWVTCTWDIRSLADDGDHVVAFNPEFAWAVVNLRTGRPVIALGDAIRADSFRFDRLGQLNMVVRSHDGQTAIATCTLDGRCWLATPWTVLEYILVQPNDS